MQEKVTGNANKRHLEKFSWVLMVENYNTIHNKVGQNYWSLVESCHLNQD